MVDDRKASKRWYLAEVVERRLDPAMGMLGIVFALIVVAEAFIRPRGSLGAAVTVAGWVLWAIFVAEFGARLVIAPSKGRFLKKNWWQAVFLAFPFLRLLRVMRAARLARAGRLVSSSLRAGRTAASTLTGRVGWLVGVTLIVVLGTSQFLFEFGGYESYGEALYDSAMAAVTGAEMEGDSTLTRIFGVGLAVYSVVVFASLAAALGAFFMQQRTGDGHEALPEHPPGVPPVE
jgi:voltage-gated potassium channel